jgi:anaerobic magnesium-protoporphyrin IX monomethyl ester cyclase
MTKVVLVIPPPQTRYFQSSKLKQEPLGALYLGKIAENLCDFSIIDGFSNYLSEDDIFKQIESIDPDIVGFSVNFYSLLPKGLKIAVRVKTALNKTIIFGGNISTFLYENLIKLDYIDYIFLHEAEYSFANFLKKKQGNNLDFTDISGLVYKFNGEMKINPFKDYETNLDALPIPDHKLLNGYEAYSKAILSSRGCPYDCIYCSTKEMWGLKWRKRTAENIFGEIKHLYDNFKVNSFHFVDDNFLIDKERFANLVEIMEKNNLLIPFGFSARLELIDEKVLEVCKRVGVNNLFFGIESGSNRVLKQLNRNYTQDDIYHKIDLCIKNGIIPTTSFMIGIPYEDKDDARETLKVMKNINTHLVQVHICTPLVGTKLYKNPGHFKIKIDYNGLESGSVDSEPIMETNYLSKDEIFDFYLEGLGIMKERASDVLKYRNSEKPASIFDEI